jgi:hypothetical protein
MVENSDRCWAFNIYDCFYQKLFSAYGAPELTAYFCKGDDLLFTALPPQIRWARTRTLGRGDALCDFRWERVPA